ncbi:MAG: hypothetical protein J6X03_00800 [Bacilli bacterium]|nr:hypothetical protein [Bacilli bacterium]
MPFVSVKTNKTLNSDQKIEVKSSLGKLIKLLPGKSENWLMVDIEDSKELYFRGTNDPAIMVEVKLYGGASQSSLENFTNEVTKCFSGLFEVETSRIYVSYFATNDWGYDGSNF